MKKILTVGVAAMVLGGAAGARAGGATLTWSSAAKGVPANAFVGGYEKGRALVVCRAAHEKGTHPGKVVDGRCNIGWGGKEVVLSSFEVLTVSGFTNWVAQKDGNYPKDAVVGGQEPGRSLVVCRAAHLGGLHPGKIVGKNCNIGYGGAEVLKNDYEVLVAPEY